MVKKEFLAMKKITFSEVIIVSWWDLGFFFLCFSVKNFVYSDKYLLFLPADYFCFKGGS